MEGKLPGPEELEQLREGGVVARSPFVVAAVSAMLLLGSVLIGGIAVSAKLQQFWGEVLEPKGQATIGSAVSLAAEITVGFVGLAAVLAVAMFSTVLVQTKGFLRLGVVGFDFSRLNFTAPVLRGAGSRLTISGLLFLVSLVFYSAICYAAIQRLLPALNGGPDQVLTGARKTVELYALFTILVLVPGAIVAWLGNRILFMLAHRGVVSTPERKI